MPISCSDSLVRLTESCSIEDAEALHALLRSIEAPVFDLAEAGHLHTAIVQLIMASGGRVQGLRADPLLAACLQQATAA
jgi:hypothetical protein